jgi:hypothetical protein
MRRGTSQQEVCGHNLSIIDPELSSLSNLPMPAISMIRGMRYTTREKRGQEKIRGLPCVLSHSHKGRWIARQCARLIKEAAKPYVEVFLDEKDIEGGQSIPDSIRIGIEECDEFVVLLSRYSKDRPWVFIEMAAAWGLRKHIVAIIDKIGPKEVPGILSPHKAIDLTISISISVSS